MGHLIRGRYCHTYPKEHPTISEEDGSRKKSPYFMFPSLKHVLYNPRLAWTV